MQILRIPHRLAGALAVLALAPLGGALHVLMADPRPWWRIPLVDLGMGALWVAAVIFPIGSAFLRGTLGVRSALIPLSALWVVSVFVQATLQHNVGLAFFGVGLLVYALVAVQWLWRESERSYFNPRLAWFEGVPAPIHSLSCELIVNEQKVKALPARIDFDGAYLFAALDATLWSKISAIELSEGAQSLRVPVKSTTAIIRDRMHGFGLRFEGVSPDTQKELGDLLERLRVHGYAT